MCWRFCGGGRFFDEPRKVFFASRGLVAEMERRPCGLNQAGRHGSLPYELCLWRRWLAVSGWGSVIIFVFR